MADNMTLAQILEKLKNVRQNNHAIVNSVDVVAGAGGYYNFPHTRTYDSDLGFLIKMYEELTNKYDNLLISFDEFIEILNSILNEIDVSILEEINKLLKEGKIYLDTDYIAEKKALKFIFKGV